MGNQVIVITGISGQLGAYLSRLYLNYGYRVIGCARNTSNWNPWRLRLMETLDKITIEHMDLSDQSSIDHVVCKYKPDYFVNAGGMSFVGSSWNVGAYTLDVTGIGVFRCLESLKRFSPSTKFLQMSSSEIFGDNPKVPWNEESKQCPSSPYSLAKQLGHSCVQSFRRSFGIFASNLISLNFTSSLQSSEFLPLRVIKGAIAIHQLYQRKQDITPLSLGRIDTARNWLSAQDTALAVKAILDYESPDDFCICSGKPITVKDFCSQVFDILGYHLWWQEGNLEAIPIIPANVTDTVWRGLLNNQVFVESLKSLYRPSDVMISNGSYDKAFRLLGWSPTISLEQILRDMIKYELTGEFIPPFKL